MPAVRIGLLVLAVAGVVGCDRDVPDPRSTDVVVLDVGTLGDLVAFGDPVRITDRDGYDNQPAFTADGRALLFSSRFGPQVDVYRYAIDEPDLDRLTLTLESEFSPQPLPDGPGFSCVRVEQDGRQRLWAFDPAADTAPRLLLPSPDYVGYYAWAADGTVALHVRGRLPALWLVKPPGEPRVVYEGIGRSVQAVPDGGGFSFTAEGGDGATWIHVVDVAGDEVRPVVPALEGSLDHAWLPDGTLLMAREATIYARRPGEDDAWSSWIDLADYGARGITRIAVSPAGDRLAFAMLH